MALRFEYGEPWNARQELLGRKCMGQLEQSTPRADTEYHGHGELAYERFFGKPAGNRLWAEIAQDFQRLYWEELVLGG